MLVCSTADGVNWSNYTATGQYSHVAPSLAAYNNRLYVAFVGTDASQPVLVCSTADGVNWSNYTATGQYSHVAPSLAAYNNRLYVAYVADDGTGNLYVTSSADGANWANNTKTGQSSSLAPSLAVVPFEATDPSNELEINPPQPPDIPGWGLMVKGAARATGRPPFIFRPEQTWSAGHNSASPAARQVCPSPLRGADHQGWRPADHVGGADDPAPLVPQRPLAAHGAGAQGRPINRAQHLSMWLGVCIHPIDRMLSMRLP